MHVLPGRFQIVWPLIAILLVLAILIVGVANLFVSPRAPKVHAAGYAGPAWVLRAQAAPKASSLAVLSLEERKRTPA